MNKDTHDGIIYAAAAFIMWGLLPVYWKALEEVPALELLCNRIVWSLFFVGILLSCKKRWAEVRSALADKRARSCSAQAAFSSASTGSFIYGQSTIAMWWTPAWDTT